MQEISYLIIAGEKSGEEHALSFVPQMQQQNANLSFFGVGGDLLKQEGVELLYHLKEFSSWGYSGILSKIPFYLKALKRIEKECIRRNTRYAILIDYQEFNLKLAKRLKALGIQVNYYVAPQAWAWKEWRVKYLKKNVDHLFTILPFEKKWFQDRGVQKVYSVTHPVASKYKDLKIYNQGSFPAAIKEKQRFSKGISIGLFPGSRKSEILNHLPIFVKALHNLKKSSLVLNQNFIVYPSHYKEQDIRELITDQECNELNIKLVANNVMDKILRKIDFAIAASGTINLSLAYNKIPTVVCYTSGLVNEFVFKVLVKYNKPVSLPNIMWGRKNFPELLQENCTDYNIALKIKDWINNPQKLVKLTKALEQLNNDMYITSFDVAEFLLSKV